jgi:hypothetical protein
MQFKSKISSLFASLALLVGLVAGGNVARGQGCAVYPIALSAQTLAGVTNGTVLPDIFNGVQPGNFGWLSWTGAPDEPTLVASLTVPGNSSTYVNPLNSADHNLVTGNWVYGSPGVANSDAVRNALDTLEDYEIVVPVWDQTSGTGSGTMYHISGFATIRILGYRLPHLNRISAVFLGYTDCASGGPGV